MMLVWQEENQMNDLFFVHYVDKRAWQPIQRPNKGRKMEAQGKEMREVRSSLLILDWKVANCRAQESNKNARRSINCMFLDEKSFSSMPS